MAEVTIMLRADQIPNETVVHKVGGVVEFVLRTKGVPLYSYMQDRETEVLCKGLLVLQNGETLEVVSSDRQLAIDFNDFEDAADFLMEVYGER
jgi:hypothetical protein